MLPMILTTSQVLWFACIVIPLISISLMVQTVEQDVMKKPQGKFQMNLKMNVRFVFDIIKSCFDFVSVFR